MSAAPAGWYRDPSGIPNAFRWWDGATWTTTISASSQAPAPLSTAPAGPHHPGVDAGSGTVGGASAAAGSHRPSPFDEGQPAGTGAPHPGPDYEPAAWQQVRTGPPAGPPPPAPAASAGMSAGKIAALFGGVLALVLVIGGSFLYVNRSHQPKPPPPVAATTSPVPTSPGVSPAPTPTPEPTTSAPPTATPPQPQTPTQPAPGTSPPAQNTAHFVFATPAKRWKPALAGVLAGPTQWQAYFHTTEADYNGTSSWVAIMVSFDPDPAWAIAKHPKAGLLEAAQWYEAANFGGAAVHPKTVTSRAITIDGKPGRYLQVHLTYDIPKVKAKGETATLVAVPTKAGTAVFLSSVPDTNKSLQADADAAIKSLKIVK